MKLTSYNALMRENSVKGFKTNSKIHGDKYFETTLEKFEKVAFKNGRSNDPLERWNQIKKGLHAINYKGKNVTSHHTHHSSVHSIKTAVIEKPVESKYTPVQQAALEVAKLDLVSKIKENNRSQLSHKTTQLDSKTIDPVKHWLRIKSGMRAGQLNKVQIKVHIAKENESLEEIAKKFAGDSSLAGIIGKYNNIPLNGEIEKGTLIKIPTGGIIDRLKAFRG